jgi:hypothetical protein
MLGQPIRFRCPTCDAHAGERCVEPETGDLMENFHHARQMAAIPRDRDRAARILEGKRGFDIHRDT